jgi:hypothetical protein
MVLLYCGQGGEVEVQLGPVMSLLHIFTHYSTAVAKLQRNLTRPAYLQRPEWGAAANSLQMKVLIEY